MTGSLQEQLLKAGLVNKQQVNDARKKKSKQFKKGKQKNEPSLAKAYADRKQAERKERDQELNRRREEAKRRKELKEQLKKIIVPASKNKKTAEIARFFEFARKIRKILEKLLFYGRFGAVGRPRSRGAGSSRGWRRSRLRSGTSAAMRAAGSRA